MKDEGSALGKIVGGGLLTVSLVVFGVFSVLVGAPANIRDLIILLAGVGAPGVAGVALLARLRQVRRIAARHEESWRQTRESEVIRLARRLGGKVTVLEVVADSAMGTEAAKEMLDALVTGELADMEVTESGLIVYSFPDLQRLDEKDRAKGILEG